ncbi:hypothetical protein PLANPX_5208 [Lacipirellula parvula]|uniref:Uncharacterized protein n=1 Tax=Lacipirellula parvula TaxID=2650471 RepID=A0A5K7XLP3_9BACT|nr:hypothetical protein PLANPX_5208 [Lacipirellula parvula]
MYRGHAGDQVVDPLPTVRSLMLKRLAACFTASSSGATSPSPHRGKAALASASAA